MSSGPKMSLPFARNLANHMLEILSPECDRIEIAGSIRRQKPEVGDIEIVLIPKPIPCVQFTEEPQVTIAKDLYAALAAAAPAESIPGEVVQAPVPVEVQDEIPF